MLLNDVSSRGLVDSHLWTSCNNAAKNNLHYDFRIKCSVRLYLQLFVGGHMSYWAYLCLFAYNSVQHILLLCPYYIKKTWTASSVFYNVYLHEIYYGIFMTRIKINILYVKRHFQYDSFLKAEYIRKTNTISRCTSIKN